MLAATRSPTRATDTRAIQGWLGHRSITSTAVYMALGAEPVQGFLAGLRGAYQGRWRLQGERDTGGWMYQLFIIGGNPLTWESDNRDYLTQHEAERAGHEAIAAKRDKGRL